MYRRHKIRVNWHKLQKQISEQHEAPVIRKKSYQGLLQILGCWDYPYRGVPARSWKSYRKTQYRPLV